MINKNSKLMKVLKGTAALAVVAGITIGATYAFLSDKTEEKVNTFKASADIELELTEPNWDQTGEASHFAPGSEIPKDPTVAVPESSSQDEYVASTVKYYVDLNGDKEYTADEEISYDVFTSTYATISGYNTTDWTPNAEKSIYYFGTSATDAEGLNVFKKGNESVIFEKVTVNKNIPTYTEDTKAYKKGTPIAFRIDVKAYGVQDSLTKDQGYQALNLMIEGKDPNTVIK